MNSKNSIAIIGMEGLFPGSSTLDEFYRNLRDGKDCVSEPHDERISNSTMDTSKTYKPLGFLDRVDLFDHSFFNISKKDACYMDPYHRLLL